MVNYNFNNKEYLLGIKPSYKFIPIIILITLVIIFISICYFKTYDVFVAKGYILCDDECKVSLGVNIDEINKIIGANMIKINDKSVNYNNIIVGDIQIDEVNKINIQNVNINLNQVDDK